MTNKIPINEIGGGNCCPLCGSIKISEIHTIPVEVEVDRKTRKTIYRRLGKIEYRPSNRMLAARYMRLLETGGEDICWYFSCRKCGWKSELFVP